MEQAEPEETPLLFNIPLESAWCLQHSNALASQQEENTYKNLSNIEEIRLTKLQKQNNNQYNDQVLIENQSTFIKWTDYNRVYENMYKMLDFPPPSCLFCTENYISVGTSKAHVMIFNYGQFIMHLLVPEDQDFRSTITKIETSYDGTHIAAACVSGDILIWDLNEPKILDENSNEVLPSIFQIEQHRDSRIESLGFVSNKSNALIVSASDNNGNTEIVYHHLSKSKLWPNQARKLNSTKIPIILPSSRKSSGRIFAEPLTFPLEFQQHIVAVLHQNALQLLSLNSENGILFARSFKNQTLFFGNLIWNIFDPMSLYYSIENILYYHTFKMGTGNTLVISDDKNFDCKEPILKITPISKYLVTVLTASGRLCIIDSLADIQSSYIIANLDISAATVVNSVQQSLSCTSTQIAILTRTGMKVGRFSSWSTIILQNLQSGKPTAALDFLFRLSKKENNSVCSLLNLSDDMNKRKLDLAETFRSLLLASIQYFTKSPTVNMSDQNLSTFFYQAVFLDYYFDGLDMKMSQILNDSLLETNLREYFYEAYLEFIYSWSDTELKVLPPSIVQNLVEYCSQNKKQTALCEIVFKLSPACYDIDKMMRLFHNFELYEMIIFLWNSVFQDYITPIVEVINLVSNNQETSTFFQNIDSEKLKGLLFSYLHSLMTGTSFPTEKKKSDDRHADKTKEQLLNFVFSASSLTWPVGSYTKIYTMKSIDQEPVFPYFKFLLNYDINYCLSWLNVIFKESFFNFDKEKTNHFEINRQFIIDVLLDILKEEYNNELSKRNVKVIAIFIALSASTYEQFIFLSTKSVDKIFKVLCRDNMMKFDSENALRYLIAEHGENLSFEKYTDLLEEHAYFESLFDICFHEQKYLECLKIYCRVGLKRSSIFKIMEKCLDQHTDDSIGNNDMEHLISQNFEKFLLQDPIQLAHIVENWFPELHSKILILNANTNVVKLKYLREISNLPMAHRPHISSDILLLYAEILGDVPGAENELEKILEVIEVTSSNIAKISRVLRNTGRCKLLIKFLVKHKELNKAITQVTDIISSNLKNKPPNVDEIFEFSELGLQICQTSDSADIWSEFFLDLFMFYQKSDDPVVKGTCSNIMESIIVRLALVSDEQNHTSVVRVLTTVLENGSIILSKTENSEKLLRKLFQTYEVEKTMAAFVLKIFNRESAGLITNYISKSLKGWLLLNQECRACGDKLYGSFTKVSNQNENTIVVFTSGHGYHQNCVPIDTKILDTSGFRG